jgi:hypothetical protein
VHLVEIGVVDQRYQAVMAVVQDGWKVSERALPPSPNPHAAYSCSALAAWR